MPIYEYECRSCHAEFELLVRTGDVPACPSCRGQELERLLSGFSVNTREMTLARVKSARASARASQDFKDKKVAEAEDFHEHMSEHGEPEPDKSKKRI